MENLIASPDKKVHYFAIDYGRAKEVYHAYFYSSVPLDGEEFDVKVVSAARSAALLAAEQGSSFRSDFAFLENIIANMDAQGLQQINLAQVIWDQSFDEQDASQNNLVLLKPEKSVTDAPVIVCDFNDLYQDSFNRIMLRTPMDPETLLTQIKERMVQETVSDWNGLVQCIPWNDCTPIGFHCTFFGCNIRRISDYWDEILGKELFERLYEIPSDQTPIIKQDLPSTDGKEDELPF